MVKASSEVKMLKSENALLQDELRRARESAEKGPSTVMSSLVDKLRNDIAAKDKKIRAMGRIISDLKTELVDNAAAMDTRKETAMEFETSVDLEEAKRKIDDLNRQNEKLTRQIETLKEKQVFTTTTFFSLDEMMMICPALS